MKNIKLYCFIITTIAYIQTNAQQDVTFTLYNYNMNIVNPAYAGTSDRTEFTSNFRSQFIGIENSPETQSFSLSIPTKGKIGAGLSVVNSSVYVLNETDLHVDFSYRLQLSETTDLFLGLKAGGSFVNIDLAKTDIDNDPLFANNVNVFNPNIGVGAYLKGSRFYLNVSAPAILKTERYEKKAGVVTEASDVLHLYTGVGYHFPLGEEVTFTPSLLARMVSGIPFSMDISGTLSLYKKIELGVSHRLEESISGLVFFKMADWVRIGYAYDNAITNLGNYSQGSHEVILQLRF
ncbi:type IX secretion system membrane protein PorP/SprF [Flagellimonas sp.]|uniref:PorP/SprF family type IX secretion system membrane protein n=1 Tax=Flagellimonas sp. TaxID=2058762 RepID=UPI003B50E068